VFGKPISQYLAFPKVFLGLVVVVGLTRLGLSLAGLPNATVAWFSMNVVSWAAVAYYGVAVHTKGFGAYRQLLPLGFFQIAAQQVVAILGILLALAGLDNIFGAPEYSFGAKSQWIHLLSHLTIGLILPTLLFWGVGSLILAITKRVSTRPAHA
jgi:hypothetical protein